MGNADVKTKTFLDLIGMGDIEQPYSNMLFNVIKDAGVFRGFCIEFDRKGLFDQNGEFSVFMESSVVEGRSDICAESDRQRVIIVNKLLSCFNGVNKENDPTQLSKYYKWGKTGKLLEPVCFLVIPDHRLDDVYREIREYDPDMESIYQPVKYSDVSRFIEIVHNTLPETSEFCDLFSQVMMCFYNRST